MHRLALRIQLTWISIFGAPATLREIIILMALLATLIGGGALLLHSLGMVWEEAVLSISFATLLAMFWRRMYGNGFWAVTEADTIIMKKALRERRRQCDELREQLLKQLRQSGQSRG